MVGHRNCSVIGCGNSGAKLKKWLKILCPTHQCNQGSGWCNCPPPFTLFTFPTQMRDNDRRQRWIKTINRKCEQGRNWEPNNNSRVCSRHFPDGSPTEENPDPYIDLGYTPLSKMKKVRKHPMVRTPTESPVPTKKSRMDIQQNASHCHSDTEDPIHAEDEHSIPSPNIVLQSPETDNFSCQNEACQNSTKDKEIDELRKSNEKLKQDLTHLRKLKATSQKKQNKQFTWKSLKSDKKLKTFTGIPNKAAFNALYKLIEKKVPKITYWHGPSKVSTKRRKFVSTPKKSGPQRALSSKDEFVLTLMKLRLGSINADLADRFGISQTTVSKIINTWVRFLANELKCLIHNPPKEIAMQHLPKKFTAQKYRNVRHIIDCTEMFIETPKDPKLKAATWSDYKHHQTLKVLVSIMPCGTFNFVSEGWGGRTSDIVVTRESGFYDLLEYGDEVMADKGFTIAEDLLIRHARLHIPPGKRGQEQMGKQAVKKTKEIANLRIFVEQAIRRLKTFHILKNEMPITLLDKFDDVVTICAAICNLYPKLCT